MEAWFAAATRKLPKLNPSLVAANCRLSANNPAPTNVDLQPRLDGSNLNVEKKNVVIPVQPKQLKPFGSESRVRRTSILRSQSFVSHEKKNVRFADSMGGELENVRYFVISPQINRRYSSYTPPTYLNNEWNTNQWNWFTEKATDVFSSKVSSMKNDFTLNSHPKQLSQRYELVAANFTSPSLNLDFNSQLQQKRVLLHSLTTAETTVYGTVSVMNLHFVKKVIVRYTFDDWKTSIEREASYMPGSNDGNTDKFSFVIYAKPQDFNVGTIYPLSRSSRMFFAIQYAIGDNNEFWDNNNGRNYCLNLTPY